MKKLWESCDVILHNSCHASGSYDNTLGAFISIFLLCLTLCTQLKWHSFGFTLYLCSNKILGKVYLVPLILGLYNICMVTVVQVGLG